VQAARNINIKVPIVVRLAGTNAEEAAVILEKSGINFLVAHNFQEAAEKVTQAIAA
jgi:succinyl-CoA synthetase beta subunit